NDVQTNRARPRLIRSNTLSLRIRLHRKRPPGSCFRCFVEIPQLKLQQRTQRIIRKMTPMMPISGPNLMTPRKMIPMEALPPSRVELSQAPKHQYPCVLWALISQYDVKGNI